MIQRRLTKISNIVDYLIDKYHNRDPFYIAKVLGVSITFCNLTKDVPAFSGRNNSNEPGYIYINSNLSKYSQKILCAHELGHLCLHEGYCGALFDPEIYPRYEYEANYFAAKLMPHIMVNTDVDSYLINELNDYIAEKVIY